MHVRLGLIGECLCQPSNGPQVMAPAAAERSALPLKYLSRSLPLTLLALNFSVASLASGMICEGYGLII
jgi:hypothetical protein